MSGTPMKPAGSEAERPIPPALRAYWHSTVLDLARRDCCLLHLLPFDAWDKGELSKLPPDRHKLVLEKIEQLVQLACGLELKIGKRPGFILRRCAESMWNFLKPWNCNPDGPSHQVPTQPTLFEDPTP